MSPAPELAGSRCVHCGEEIAGDQDGRFCTHCGQPVHTRCIRLPSPYAEYGCPECGIDSGDERTVGRDSGGGTGPFPVSVACPKCGSGEFKVVKPEAFVAFRWDRVCKACGTRYTPPTPRWAGVVFVLVGLLLATFGAFAVVTGLLRGNPLSIPAMTCEGFLGVIGLLAIGHGVRTLVKPGQV